MSTTPIEPLMDGIPTMRSRHEALPAGTRLDGYEIRAVMSEGALGCVYLASRPASDRHVVVREYLPVALAARGEGPLVALRQPTGTDDAYHEGLRAFVHEGRLLSRIEHPSLMRVLQVWEANHTAYMALPFYDGGTLAEARQAMRAPPGEAWVRRLLDDLLQALAVLHGEHCLHRHLSPGHVMLLRDGRALLQGPRAALQVLGARAQTSHTEPGFSPIEEYDDSGQMQQGPWTDVYALAAVARFAILGSAPVPATVRSVRDPLVPLAIAVQELRAQFPDIDYSAGLLLAVDFAMAVDPRQRPQSLRDFEDVLNSRADESAARAGEAAAAPAPAPVAEPVSDPVVASLQANLGAMLDAALTNAPPLRSVRVAAVAPAVPPSRGGIEPSFDTATTTPGSMYADTSFEGLPTEPGDLDVPVTGPQAADAGATRDAPLRRAPPSRWPRRLGIGLAACGVAALVGALAWQALPRDGDRLLPSQATVPAPAVREAGSAAESPAMARANAALSAADSVVQRSASAALPSVSAASAPAIATPASNIAAGPPATVASAASAASVKPAAPQPITPPAAPKPPLRREAVAAVAAPATPRAACGTRTEFSLYNCMKQQCVKPQYLAHAQCQRLRESDRVD